MQKLIFDIETYGPEFAELPIEIQEYLLEKFSNDFKEKSREDLIEIINEKISLLPQFSEIVAISFYNPDTQRGAVYFQSKEEIEDWSENLIDFKRFSSEEELIKKFWEIVPNYQEIITFNGNKFDIPFLLYRSLKHKIRPTYAILDKEYHIDLYEKLSFNNRIQKLSLKLTAFSFGLEDPKEKFDGKKVRDIIKNKDYKSLVYYALGDVLTTAKIYELWTNYLRYF